MIVFESIVLALELVFYIRFFHSLSNPGQSGLKIALGLFYGIPALVLLYMFYVEICMGELEPFLFWVCLILVVPIGLAVFCSKQEK